MDDSEPNNNSSLKEMFKDKRTNPPTTHTATKTWDKSSQFPLLRDICHLSCNEQNSNVVARLNLGGQHDTFNSSSLYIVHTVRIQEC